MLLAFKIMCLASIFKIIVQFLAIPLSALSIIEILILSISNKTNLKLNENITSYDISKCA